MCRNIYTLGGIPVFLTICAFSLSGCGQKNNTSVMLQEIKPAHGMIETFISTTGTVLPKNRLEIKPPVGGRVQEILVKEGERVQAGQTLAQMSSTERAAMLDAARGQGEEKVKYWEEVYKPIILVSPAAGEVIVAKTQPGQTVTVNDAVIVLSDQLIVRAQVDETDIGKIKTGQAAFVTLDAYPDAKIQALVGHIYYESETVNNVTIYKVDLIPDEIPSFFRSGMNAAIDFRVDGKDDALLIPVEAVHKEKAESYVLLKQAGSTTPVKRVVTLGITDDKNYEIRSGLRAADTVVFETTAYAAPAGSKTSGSNPFLPKMPTRQRNQRGPPPG